MESMLPEKPLKHPMLSVLSIRSFRLLFFGSTTSILGDQFAFIATPWLILRLTGDPLALGLVLALGGIPRAVFMLLGGAITDRFSPRLIMLLSDIIRFILTVLMALVVFTGTVQVWMLYGFSLGFGLVAGFAIPASYSIVPMLVAERELAAGNSAMMGVTQLVGFIGPTVAGILIGRDSNSSLGIGLAFAIDALSFAVSAVCLTLMQGAQKRISEKSPSGNAGVWAAILAGLKYLWDDKPLMLMFLVITALNFLFVGPLLVGIPVLASQRLTEGAVAFGLLMSAFAGGNLVGYLLAGSLPRPNSLGMRLSLIALMTILGLVLCSLGFIRLTWLDFSLMLLIGLGNGYISIMMFTWMQKRTPKEMLGRMMAMMMLSNTGLVPISQAISGAVSKLSLTALFVGAGVLVLLLTVVSNSRPEMIAVSKDMASTPELAQSPAGDKA